MVDWQHYLTMAAVPALMEAFDRDANAYISVYEVNIFVDNMPNWPLVDHLVFSAAGACRTAFWREMNDIGRLAC